MSAGIQDVPAIVILGLVEQRLNTWLGETPCAGIQRLLLRPDNVLSIGVAVEVVFEL